jgi:predicted  nucleic acid-binding Zn-ribbon protein
MQSNQALEQISKKASTLETQLDNQSKQVDALVKDPQKLSELDKAIASGQVQGEQLARLQALKQQLQSFKQDPQTLNQQVEQAQTKIRSERLAAEKQTRTGALKLGLRTGLNSLLLAIGYIVIGWTGFRSLGNSR